ncbi:MAG: hypothetical protein GPJ09_22150 [Microcystis aeruginosa SX13-01]|nr:hypothetical protein [Microcystis aeruginosa SX13-01]
MKSKSASHWSVRGGNLGTFSHTLPPRKTFSADPNYGGDLKKCQLAAILTVE